MVCDLRTIRLTSTLSRHSAVCSPCGGVRARYSERGCYYYLSLHGPLPVLQRDRPYYYSADTRTYTGVIDGLPSSRFLRGRRVAHHDELSSSFVR
jgi:hypothetical protein